MSAWRLEAELLARRYGISAGLAVAAVAAALILRFAVLPTEQARLAATEQARDAASARLAQPASTGALATSREDRHAAFRAILLPRTELAAAIEAVFAEARKQGLTLSQGEYKQSHEAAGDYDVVHIRLPLKGSYPQIRQFAEQLLLRLPAASVDEMAFRREHIGLGQTDATLRISLYFKDGG